MNRYAPILGFLIIAVCHNAIADSIVRLPYGNAGSQAKAGRAVAFGNSMGSANVLKKDSIGCNQDVGTVAISKNRYSKLRDNTVIVKGDVINLCK